MPKQTCLILVRDSNGNTLGKFDVPYPFLWTGQINVKTSPQFVDKNYDFEMIVIVEMEVA
jgi:hypothetical protein